MDVTAKHDGRIVALVIRDIAQKLEKRRDNRTILLQLTGALQAEYQFGNKTVPDCTMAIDFFAFNLAASGRISSAEARRQATITGNADVAGWFLQHIEVPY